MEWNGCHLLTGFLRFQTRIGSQNEFWDFGDSTGSDLADPFHTFLVQADHPWTVGLVVTDPDGIQQVISEGGGMKFFKPHATKVNVKCPC